MRCFLLFPVFATLMAASLVAAQPPAHPHLAPSTWPIYHANTYATASVTATTADTPAAFQAVDNVNDRRFRPGGVSPWTVLRPPTRGGDQVILTTPLSGVGKYIIRNNRLEGVDFLRLDRKITDVDWGILLLADGSALVTERKNNQFVVVADRDASPTSPLRVVRRLPVDVAQHGELTSHFTLSYDGFIIALTSKPALIALDPRTGRLLASHDLPDDSGMAIHNSFPIDERGRVYLVTQRAMMAVDWDGKSFKQAWLARYNMRGPGFENARESRRPIFDAIAVARGEPGTGSGTTPSLIGDPDTGIVVVVDGHSPANNLVAFWRGDIPPDWKPLPDPANPTRTLDPRIAGVFALPHSTPEGEGHTAENSPAVLGNAVVVAQWAGFKPDGSPPTGVQRVDWDTAQRRFNLVWANPAIHINGVPSIGRTAGGLRVFGMGREGDHYIYSALDFETGRRLQRLDLGTSDHVLDQGNSHVIAADGSIVFAGQRKLVRVLGR